MSIEIDNSGIHIQSFNEILEEKIQKYKEIYGDDIDLSQNTPDGQIVGIESKIIADFQEFAVALYNSFDPDFAQGQALDKILKLNGLRRQEATKSTADIKITTSKTVFLPSDYKIKDSLGQIWTIGNETTLNDGDHIVTFVSEKWGKVEAPANTITEFETIVLGVESVNNESAAIPGIDEESDEEMRLKRQSKLMIATQSMVAGLNAQLLNVCDDAVVYENDTDATNSDGINSHTIWCVCDGGTIEDIAKTIAISKNAGCGLRGTVETIHEETITRSNSETFVYKHEVRFDRPTYTNIHIKLDVKKRDQNSVIDVDKIKSVLSDIKSKIHQDIIVTELYSYIYNAGNGFIASNVTVSKDDVTYIDDELVASLDEKFIISSENITVTEL